MTTQQRSQIDGLIFRKTNAHVDRKICVTPDNSAMKRLIHARIVLDAGRKK
jgi:hypothetical protein